MDHKTVSSELCYHSHRTVITYRYHQKVTKYNDILSPFTYLLLNVNRNTTLHAIQYSQPIFLGSKSRKLSNTSTEGQVTHSFFHRTSNPCHSTSYTSFALYQSICLAFILFVLARTIFRYDTCSYYFFCTKSSFSPSHFRQIHVTQYNHLCYSISARFIS